MKTKFRRFLVIALSIELLFSSIGVAQVSHLCKMAVAGIEQSSCSSDEDNEHGCCNKNTPGVETTTDTGSCCTNLVKYFNNKVNSTVQQLNIDLPIQVTFVKLFFQLFSFEQLELASKTFLLFEKPPEKSGVQIILSIRSLLI